jgi:hypothetical protein
MLLLLKLTNMPSRNHSEAINHMRIRLALDELVPIRKVEGNQSDRVYQSSSLKRITRRCLKLRECLVNLRACLP